jgi:hypothetical protein
MTAFNTDFWVAAAAGAPVVALAAVVQLSDASKAVESAFRLYWDYSSDPSVRDIISHAPIRTALAAFYLDGFNMIIQAIIFVVSLVIIGQREYNPTSRQLWGIAIIEGVGIIALFVSTALTSISKHKSSRFYVRNSLPIVEAKARIQKNLDVTVKETDSSTPTSEND